MTEVLSKTLLWADDQPELVKGSAEALRRRGCDVVTVPDGEAAMTHMLEHGLPDALVADIQMPPGDEGGLWLVRTVREVHRATLPIVVVSAHGTRRQSAEAMKLGASDFVERASDPERVADQIVAVIAEHADNALDGVRETTRRELEQLEATVRDQLLRNYERRVPDAVKRLAMLKADIGRVGSKLAEPAATIVARASRGRDVLEAVSFGVLKNLFVERWDWWSYSLTAVFVNRESLTRAFDRTVRVRNQLAHAKDTFEADLLRARVFVFDLRDALSRSR